MLTSIVNIISNFVLLFVLLFHCLLQFRNSLCSVGAKTQPESKCPELLANYCDMLLRKTPLSKKLTSEEVEMKLRDVVSIYCHIGFFKLLFKFYIDIVILYYFIEI